MYKLNLPTVILIPNTVKVGHINLERGSIVIYVFCYETMNGYVERQQLLFKLHDLGEVGLEHTSLLRKNELHELLKLRCRNQMNELQM